MKTIHKFKLDSRVLNDAQEIMMPPNAKILHAGLDGFGTPCVWAEVIAGAEPTMPKRICVATTGGEKPDHFGIYVSTFVSEGGRFVFHVFIE